MKFIDFFAGIGGFRHGFELAGHKCVGFCEWDKFAAASYISMHCITEEQREKLAKLDLKHRQKEILKEEYLNGEWYATDIQLLCGDDVPQADCWTFGAPCQDFSMAGARAGLKGSRSSLVGEIFRLAEEKGDDRPEWLIYENVKGMLSSNRGADFASIILEMDRLGYDVQWQLFNSADYGVPQHRERVYTIGHLRRFGGREVLPIPRNGIENNILQIGKQVSRRDNPNQARVYDESGEAPTLSGMGGGNRQPCVMTLPEAGAMELL